MLVWITVTKYVAKLNTISIVEYVSLPTLTNQPNGIDADTNYALRLTLLGLFYQYELAKNICNVGKIAHSEIWMGFSIYKIINQRS